MKYFSQYQFEDEDIDVETGEDEDGERRLVIDDTAVRPSQEPTPPAFQISAILAPPSGLPLSAHLPSSFCMDAAAKRNKRRIQPPKKVTTINPPAPVIGRDIPHESELRYYYENALGRFLSARPTLDDVALDLSVKRRGEETRDADGGIARTFSGFSCITLPTICAPQSELNRKRPSVIKSKGKRAIKQL